MGKKQFVGYRPIEMPLKGWSNNGIDQYNTIPSIREGLAKQSYGNPIVKIPYGNLPKKLAFKNPYVDNPDSIISDETLHKLGKALKVMAVGSVAVTPVVADLVDDNGYSGDDAADQLPSVIEKLTAEELMFLNATDEFLTYEANKTKEFVAAEELDPLEAAKKYGLGEGVWVLAKDPSSIERAYSYGGLSIYVEGDVRDLVVYDTNQGVLYYGDLITGENTTGYLIKLHTYDKNKEEGVEELGEQVLLIPCGDAGSDSLLGTSILYSPGSGTGSVNRYEEWEDVPKVYFNGNEMGVLGVDRAPPYEPDMGNTLLLNGKKISRHHGTVLDTTEITLNQISEEWAVQNLNNTVLY